ncbi:MAG: carbohydrate kinase family protein [Clostridia bacterium]|nr:carbohydrate kinase family protein [Clostridiales bacterium]MBQ2976614.1 carbohydrate kinase family protein [Clostridia bacterium]MBQ6805442.1 carbohydrate kinase family protein [Clostridia bacterium]
MRNEYPQVVGIGSTVYDTLMVVDGFPQEDTKMQGVETKVQGGGPCATALVAAQKLGVTTAYMGTIGDDPFGTFMMDDLKKWNVNTDYVKVIPDTVSFHAVVVLNQKTASRTCVWNKGTVAAPTAEDLNEEVIKNAKVLHLDGHMLDAAIYAAKKCKEWGVKVSHDAGGTYPGIEKLMEYVDWLIPSEEFALKMTGAATAEEAAQKLYETYHPELVVLTQGVKGGILLDEKGMRHYDSYKVEVKDSNGCGDTFHGAFVAGKIHGLSNDDACKYASAAAAIKCTRLGARYGMANDQECRAFLKERGVEL